MRRNITKLMSIMVVSLFCVTAVAAIVISDDSAADGKTTHKMYIEVIGNDALVSSTQWISFESDGTASDFAEKATAATAKYGIQDFKFSYTEGDYLSIKYGDSGNVACYYAKDGAWTSANKTAEEYPAAEVLGFAIGGWISQAKYDALTDANKAKYDATAGFSTDWYAIKILEAKVTDAPAINTYHVFLELFTDKGKVDKSKWVTFDALADPTCFVTDATAAFKDAGWDKASLTYAGGYISMNYEGGAGMNASCYVKDDKWEHVNNTEEYLENTTLCMAFGGYITNTLYDTFDDAEKENWIFDFEYKGTKYYYTKVTESTTGWEQKNSNLVLYIVIGVVAIIAVVAIAFFVFKKKA